VREDALLMTPGPTRIPERVLLASHRVLHHRTPEFSDVLDETFDLIRPFFGAASADVLPVHATGRAAMEGAITNFFAPGDAVVACCNGSFGEMWAEFAESYGLDVRRVCEDWEHSVDPAVVEAALAGGGVRGVLCTHSDTSTAVLNPIAQIAAVARSHGSLILVDGISSVGGAPFSFDAWDLDFAVTSSQKCLMASPGLSFAVVGERAWQAVERSPFPKNYLSFEAIRSTLARDRAETPGTTPVSLVLQVREGLRMLTEEGLDHVFERHAEMAERVRTGTRALGFGLLGAGIHERSPTLTALTVPDGVDANAYRVKVRGGGVQIAVGLRSYAGSCVRVGHMGDIRMGDVDRTLEVMRSALS
jgi:aspartate aminotransferase-like enzyme